MQSPIVQTALTKAVTSSLNEKIDGEISIGKIHFLPFKTLIIKDAYLIDKAPCDTSFFEPRDTVAKIGVMTVAFSLKNLLKSEGMVIDLVSVKNVDFNLVIEGQFRNNFKRIMRKTEPKPMKNKGDVLRVKKIKIKGVHYTQVKHNGEALPDSEKRINWKDLDARADIRAHDLRIADAGVSGVVEDLEVTEKSGYYLRNSSGKVVVHSGRVEVFDLILNDPYSNIDFPYFSMVYENYKAFKDFKEKILLAGDISNTHFDCRSLNYLAKSNKLTLNADIVRGRLLGRVNELILKPFIFKESHGVEGSVSIGLNNISDTDNYFIDSRISDLKFTTRSASAFINSILPGKAEALSKFAQDEKFVFNGQLKGPGNDLSMSCTINSTAGKISGTFKAKNMLKDNTPTLLHGRMQFNDLDIGDILGSGKIHECTMMTQMDANLSKSGYSVSVDSLVMDRLNFNDYDYTNIAGAGTFLNDSFNGRIVCSDPNLNFIFQGIFNLSKKTNNALYKFYFNLGYADLNAINLDKRGLSKASMAMNANFTKISKGDILGNIDIKGLKLENREGVYRIGNASINSYSTEQNQRINFNSSFAKASFIGTKPFNYMVSALKEVTTSRELPALTAKRTVETGEKESEEFDEYSLSINAYDSRDLLSFVYPGLYIADGTSVNLNLSKDGRLETKLKSQRIALRQNYLKDLNLNFNNFDDTLRCRLTSEELNALSLKLLDNIFQIDASNNSLSVGYMFDNKEARATNGDFKLNCEFSRNEKDSLEFKILTLPSHFAANGEKWTVNPSSFLARKGRVTIPHFSMENSNQSLRMFGSVSTNENDSLSVSIQNFNLKALNLFSDRLPETEGYITGNILLTSPMADRKFGLLADIAADSTRFNGYDAGTIYLTSKWSESRECVDFGISNKLFGKSSISANGSITPSKREINAKAKLDGLELGYFKNYMTGLFSEMEGKINGDFAIAGPLGRVSVFSKDARIDDAVARLAFTNVQYSLDGPVSVSDNMIAFDDLNIRDRFNGSGAINGGLRHDHLKNMIMDTKVSINNMEAFNTEDDGESFIYGQLGASGSILIHGPMNELSLDIDARTADNGSIHIPLRSNRSVELTNLLTFKKPEFKGWVDPYEEMMKLLSEKEKGKRASLTTNINMRVTPEVQCDIEIDKNKGNVLSAMGNGDIKVSTGKGGFRINGDYNLVSGNFHFNALNIASKKFVINNGSTIKFNGDIMESDLNIDATYKTSASLSTLIADTTSVSSRRDIQCGLKISDKLRNPQLGFSIDIPDLDPSTKSMVESALNTEDKVQKQFLSLLVTNSFIPSDQSGIFNSNNILVSNVMEMMSGQLNNILQRLQIPVDLGLKYQLAGGGKEVFDIAVSTQLFNNRVSVNGNIGNGQYRPSSNGQDVVGDLDIEVKMDKAGAIRLKAFSHSADKYSNFLDYSQRNGVGIGYQKEFNNFKSLFKDLFTSRKKKKEAQYVPVSEDKVTIKVDEND